MQTRLPPRIVGSVSLPGTRPQAQSAEKQPSGHKLQSGAGVSGLILPERPRLITQQRAPAPIGMLMAAAGNTDADPMTHINYLASKELQGRGSPSPGYDMASKYIAGLMQKYGLEGANPGDSSGNPYFQTFSLFSAKDDEGLHLTRPKFGRDLFQKGFYIDDTLTDAERSAIKSTVAKRTGDTSNLNGPELSPKGLEKAGFTASNVQNVVGVMRGSGPHKDEYVVVMCHLDHLGARGNTFYPGADDNASGSGTNASTFAGLQALQKAGKLDRSVLFIFTAAEEKGLVGANYFIKHVPPGIPKSAIKASINNDMVGRFEKERISAILTTKGEKTPLTDFFWQANESLGDRKFTIVNQDLQEFEDRQDNDVFTKAGYKTLFLFEGLTNPAGGGGENEDYHSPRDTPDKIVRDNGGEKVARLRDLTTKLVELASNATNL